MQQNIQPKDEQVNNEHAKSQQPKKMWVEPELVRMDDVIETGKYPGNESMTRAS